MLKIISVLIAALSFTEMKKHNEWERSKKE